MRFSEGHSILCFIFIILLGLPVGDVRAQQTVSDADELGMALEYFQSEKYHESLLLFQKLDKRYKLNPRFRAYIGLCYYYEWDYKKSVKYFDAVLPKLQGLSPHELNVYYHAAAESYFQLQKYEKALPYFMKNFSLSYDREKGDICYRIGLCHMFLKQWYKARDYYSKAEDYYTRYLDIVDREDRLAQTKAMLRGCEKQISFLIDDERAAILRDSQSVEDAGETNSFWDNVNVPEFQPSLP